MAFKVDLSQSNLSVIVDGITIGAITGDAQLIKIVDARAGGNNLWNVEADGAARVVADAVSTASLSNTAASATVVTLLASNAARRGMAIFNDSASAMYVKFGTAASTTSFTVKIPAGGYYEMPDRPIYTGAVTALWDIATGNARVTEL